MADKDIGGDCSVVTKVPPGILFVDDQPEVTSALSDAFRKQPFEVHTANSAAAGLEILAQKPIEAVISDEQMPLMSGSRFLSIVRQQYPEAIRMILSGQASFNATLAAINEAQAHRFLIKSCSAADIALSVAQAMDERDRKLREGAERVRLTEVARLQMIRDCDAAIECLWMAFQPIVWAGTFDVFAYEALVRSDHPKLKTPQLLFEVAEESQRVPQLERSARRLIGEQAALLPDDVCMMVNLHPRSLGDVDLYSPDSPLFASRHRVILEITERDKLHEITGASEGLARLRSLGYRVAIDDLGAGYAALNSFAMIRPDVVKFDFQLVRGINADPMKLDLVRAITRLCKELGILTVAEGIETAEECAAVIDVGCDLLQGYYISHPMRGFIKSTLAQTHAAGPVA
jgi:EAL domain-containing protein (putative c-di-GMP-specific phosphodiesterase class I)